MSLGQSLITCIMGNCSRWTTLHTAEESNHCLGYADELAILVKRKFVNIVPEHVSCKYIWLIMKTLLSLDREGFINFSRMLRDCIYYRRRFEAYCLIVRARTWTFFLTTHSKISQEIHEGSKKENNIPNSKFKWEETNKNLHVFWPVYTTYLMF